MKTRIPEGYYEPYDLACMLLRASGNYIKAKKLLTLASNEKPAGMNDSAVYLAAYGIKKKRRCNDHTALKRLLGPGKYRVYWDRLKKHKQTLRQVARLLGAKATSKT